MCIRDSPGVYRLIAGSVPDNELYIGGLTEVFGMYRSEERPVFLVGNGDFEGIDFDLNLQVPLSQLSPAKADDLDADLTRTIAKCRLVRPTKLRDEEAKAEVRCKTVLEP